MGKVEVGYVAAQSVFGPVGATVMGTVLAAIVFFWMGIFAPGIASGLITGAPQLGAGSAVGATAGVAAGTYVAGMGGRAAVGAECSLEQRLRRRPRSRSPGPAQTA